MVLKLGLLCVLAGSLTAAIIKDDFLVNDDITGGCIHSGPRIAMNSSGRFAVVWIDQRNCNVGGDIYGQLFDSPGKPHGSNFRINDDAVLGTSHNSPSAAMNEDGSFFVIWADWRNSSLYGSDIYGQLFDSAGKPVGQNYTVEDEMYGHELPSISTDGAARCVAVWQAWATPDGGQDIYGRIFDNRGMGEGLSFEISNDTVGCNMQEHPSVAMNQKRKFVVVWHDYQYGEYFPRDVYGRCFNADGSGGLIFRIDDDTSGVQGYPSAGIDSSGNFWVVWEDKRNGNYDIFCQRYDQLGNPQGRNFRINDDQGSSDHLYPRIAVAPSGWVYVVWEDYRNGAGDPDIYLQQFDPFGVAVGGNYRVNSNGYETPEANPAVALTNRWNCEVVWQENWTPNHIDIYGNNLWSQHQNFVVNDDIGSSNQGKYSSSAAEASIAMGSSGRSIIVWTDARHDHWDIYAELYDASGNPLTKNFPVAVMEDSSQGLTPVAAMDSSGNFIVVYCERNGTFDEPRRIFARRYDPSGNPLGPIFQAADDTTGEQYEPSVAMDKKGNFVIAWTDERRGWMGDIYAQFYDASGKPVGSNFLVNDDPIENWQGSSSVALDGQGNFMIVWWDNRNGGAGDNIYGQCYSGQGSPLGGNFQIDDGLSPLRPVVSPVVSVTDGISGNFVVTWIDVRRKPTGIWCAILDKSGKPLGKNFRINNSEGANNHSTGAGASGEFIVVWSVSSGSWSEVYAQRCHADGSVWGDCVSIPGVYLFPYNYHRIAMHSVAADSNRIAFLWQDNRRHKGWDIYAKITDWNLMGIAEGIVRRAKGKTVTVLPNPAHRTFQISFTQPQSGPVSLKIYDASGRLVKTLIQEKLKEGEHTIKLTTSGLATGVYFIELKQDKKRLTEKLLILK
jgi:hypothetical protein